MHHRQLRIKDRVYPLEEFHAVYQRMMDDRSLPELEPEPPLSRLYAPGFQFIEALSDTAHSLIRDNGFRIPETLVTNDPALVREFRAQHGRVIY